MLLSKKDSNLHLHAPEACVMPVRPFDNIMLVDERTRGSVLVHHFSVGPYPTSLGKSVSPSVCLGCIHTGGSVESPGVH